MLNRILISLSLLALVTANVCADVKVGDIAPPISADKWFNLPKGKKGIKQSDLRGQIVVIEFWATWCPPCRKTIPHLAELHGKYKNKGVILLGISDEPEKTVSKFMQSTRMPYVVAAGAEGAGSQYGVQGIPHSFLVDPEGKVVWAGYPTELEAQLDKLLKDSPPKGKSFLMTGSAKSLYKKAEGYYKKKKYEEAVESYEELAKQYGSTKEGKLAKGKLKKIKGNSSIMAKIKMAKSEREADKLLRAARALAQDGDPADAVKYYDRIIKKYPETKAAKFAGEEIGAMKDAAKKSGGDKKADDADDEDSDDGDSDDSDHDDDDESGGDEDSDEDD